MAASQNAYILCFLCIVCLHYRLVEAKRSGCRFSLQRDIPKPTPIILSAVDSKILYPDSEGFLKFRKREPFRLFCSGTKFNDKYVEGDTVTVTCHHGAMVQLGNRVISVRILSCHGYPKSTTRVTGTGCYKKNDTTFSVEVGFQVPLVNSIWKSVRNFFTFDQDDGFITQYTVCFDNVTKTNVYSLYDHSMLDHGYQVNKERGSFNAEYYDFRVGESYHWRNEQDTLAKILNSTDLAATYVAGDRVKFLSRGHVTPRADFVYGFEQAATMYYINAIPQWQQFNGGNWESLEKAVRKFMEGKSGLNYKVVTGTYGSATLPDVKSQQKELYLHKDPTTNRTMLTVPMLCWKILYDRTIESGFGFVGVNNPYLESIPDNYRICSDMCYKLDWIKFDEKNIQKGHITCCEMNELMEFLGITDLFDEE